MENFGDVSDHNFIFGGDWNFIFDSKLDANGGSPTIKRKTFAELIKLSEKYDLADIFRVRHPEKRRFSFRQNTPRLQGRLDFFLISNIMQESVQKVEIIASLQSDHSPIVLSINCLDENKRGPNYWKFNSSLLKEPEYYEKVFYRLEEIKIEHSSLRGQKNGNL